MQRIFSTLPVTVDRFRKFDLDVYILYANASGHSAYNRVEQRMPPLSKELSVLFSQLDSYGSHLNESSKTNDKELEVLNFQMAEEILAEVLSHTFIDTHPVHTELMKNEVSVNTPEEIWMAKHVR